MGTSNLDKKKRTSSSIRMFDMLVVVGNTVRRPQYVVAAIAAVASQTQNTGSFIADAGEHISPTKKHEQ